MWWAAPSGDPTRERTVRSVRSRVVFAGAQVVIDLSEVPAGPGVGVVRPENTFDIGGGRHHDLVFRTFSSNDVFSEPAIV